MEGQSSDETRMSARTTPKKREVGQRSEGRNVTAGEGESQLERAARCWPRPGMGFLN